MRAWLGLLICFFPFFAFGKSDTISEEQQKYRLLFKDFSIHLDSFHRIQEQCQTPDFVKACQFYLSKSPFLAEQSHFLELVALISAPFMEDAKTFEVQFTPNIRQINNTVRKISDSIFFLVTELSQLNPGALQEPLSQILVEIISFHGSLYRILRAQQKLRW